MPLLCVSVGVLATVVASVVCGAIADVSVVVVSTCSDEGFVSVVKVCDVVLVLFILVATVNVSFVVCATVVVVATVDTVDVWLILVK